ncbi:hypothetical protein B0T24DRAFT_15569 [Lasiosphaeria ovina]|uniref:Uncharacterized protein n=1 Tax=Lasiosphaeria ovina TaxID=92902 RepID=A0AAE0NJ93_9PEZI|nr:hypothetical protein B0T24DRAFT_15569 [Lasiosphaeria ovina]
MRASCWSSRHSTELTLITCRLASALLPVGVRPPCPLSLVGEGYEYKPFILTSILMDLEMEGADNNLEAYILQRGRCHAFLDLTVECNTHDTENPFPWIANPQLQDGTIISSAVITGRRATRQPGSSTLSFFISHVRPEGVRRWCITEVGQPYLLPSIVPCSRPRAAELEWRGLFRQVTAVVRVAPLGVACCWAGGPVERIMTTVHCRSPSYRPTDLRRTGPRPRPRSCLATLGQCRLCDSNVDALRRGHVVVGRRGRT